ncbi:hypothetical protein HPB49_014971 [Dermacentor silvarum]|uniref:Uncharacterized protein n=1 Tax=Dermacentor silvarum TaxID=543639 RepID=A0ACB8CS33_DERSI|nr:hypothetical protein HPB49_014971 [Dermacentor silvarum]
MNITVQGHSAEKYELDATDWITVLNKCNLEEKWARKAKLASEEVKVIDTPPSSPKRDGKQQAEKSIASNQEGVIHGIELNTSLQKIKQGIAEHEENPNVLEIRRLGQSKIIMLTFTTKEVPRKIKCLGAILNWYLYKKKYDACYKCGDLGH